MWKLVEEDRRLRSMLIRGVAKWLPHVHHAKPNTAGLLLAQPLVEMPHARFRPIIAAEPDRTFPYQIAHDDPVGVALANRDLVDADDLRPRRACLGELRLHVLLLECLDGVPVELEFLGDVLDRGRAAALTHVVGKALGVERVVGQEIELLALHFAAAAALNAPHLDLQVDARIAAGKIAELEWDYEIREG